MGKGFYADYSFFNSDKTKLIDVHIHSDLHGSVIASAEPSALATRVEHEYYGKGYALVKLYSIRHTHQVPWCRVLWPHLAPLTWQISRATSISHLAIGRRQLPWQVASSGLPGRAWTRPPSTGTAWLPIPRHTLSFECLCTHQCSQVLFHIDLSLRRQTSFCVGACTHLQEKCFV